MDEFIENTKPTSLEEELTELIVKKMAENKVLNKLREQITSTYSPSASPEKTMEIETPETNHQ
jgi:hypothetical protein